MDYDVPKLIWPKISFISQTVCEIFFENFNVLFFVISTPFAASLQLPLSLHLLSLKDSSSFVTGYSYTDKHTDIKPTESIKFCLCVHSELTIWDWINGLGVISAGVRFPMRRALIEFLWLSANSCNFLESLIQAVILNHKHLLKTFLYKVCCKDLLSAEVAV